VNAVVNRSYSAAGDHIRVEIFHDGLEVESPGRFPGIANTADPLHVTRFARNPRIARACADLAFGQELGEGIRRMFEEMRLAGLADPEYVQTSGSVRLSLTSTVVDRALESRLPPGARDLVRMIREGGRVSTGDLVELPVGLALWSSANSTRFAMPASSSRMATTQRTLAPTGHSKSSDGQVTRDTEPAQSPPLLTWRDQGLSDCESA